MRIVRTMIDGNGTSLKPSGLINTVIQENKLLRGIVDVAENTTDTCATTDNSVSIEFFQVIAKTAERLHPRSMPCSSSPLGPCISLPAPHLPERDQSSS